MTMARCSQKSHPNPSDTENNYVFLSVAKSNYSAITPKPLVLRQSIKKGGIFEAYTGESDKLRDVADAMYQVLLAQGPINQSGLKDPRKPDEKEIVDSIKARIPCTAAEREAALELGISLGIFDVFTDKSKDGRAPSRVRAIAQGAYANEQAFPDTLDIDDIVLFPETQLV